jgi:hypothetical protein
MGTNIDEVDGGATTGRRPPVHQMRYSADVLVAPGVSLRTTPGALRACLFPRLSPLWLVMVEVPVRCSSMSMARLRSPLVAS